MYISRSSGRLDLKTRFTPSTNPRQRLFPPQWLQECLGVSPMECLLRSLYLFYVSTGGGRSCSRFRYLPSCQSDGFRIRRRTWRSGPFVGALHLKSAILSPGTRSSVFIWTPDESGVWSSRSRTILALMSVSRRSSYSRSSVKDRPSSDRVGRTSR